MAAISSEIPNELTAGDTVQWRRTLPTHASAGGWALHYRMVGPESAYAIEATPDGDGYAVSVTAADSAGWLAGTYTVVEYVVNGAERRTLCSTTVVVRPDLAAAIGGNDARTHARRVLDNINAWLERKAPTAAAYRLGERQLQNYTLTELMALRDRYAAMVAREERGPAASRVLVRV